MVHLRYLSHTQGSCNHHKSKNTHYHTLHEQPYNDSFFRSPPSDGSVSVTCFSSYHRGLVMPSLLPNSSLLLLVPVRVTNLDFSGEYTADTWQQTKVTILLSSILANKNVYCGNLQKSGGEGSLVEYERGVTYRSTDDSRVVPSPQGPSMDGNSWELQP